MTNSKVTNIRKNDKKDVSIGSNVSLNGLVTAVFDNMVHVQIGAKIVTVHMKDLYSEINQSVLNKQIKSPSQSG
ncbi:hypothetical protein [Cytobacillus purgationiresistens]|uniref:SRNA-binding carbon storage regulator CsrA n=1 Tax=Cytobacillus purgationiresistens TaxID=863449 RepID=A0ABU0AQS3_9BACI|nr:hypothetical protein [Cytobacillus purgationiresistens]MDQ0273641.1 sRNA-binding carbon storage regulator CsrA [Cytobacillus purgationiresistens]